MTTIKQINSQSDYFNNSWEGKRYATLKPKKLSSEKIKTLKVEMGKDFKEWYDIARWKFDIERKNWFNSILAQKTDFIKTQIETWGKSEKSAEKAWKDFVNTQIKERKENLICDDIEYINSLPC